MIRALILKNGVQTHGSDFENQSQAESWVQSVSLTGAFGKVDRWIKESDLTEQEINQAVDSHEREDGIYYKFLKEFEVQYQNISAEVALKKQLSDRSRKRAFGLSLVDKIAVINQSKGLGTTEVEAFMLNPLVQVLKAHLEAGNIDTFVERLSNTNVDGLFTLAEKNSVLSDCASFLNNLGGE